MYEICKIKFKLWNQKDEICLNICRTNQQLLYIGLDLYWSDDNLDQNSNSVKMNFSNARKSDSRVSRFSLFRYTDFNKSANYPRRLCVEYS